MYRELIITGEQQDVTHLGIGGRREGGWGRGG